MSIIPNYVPTPYKTVNVYLKVSDAERAIKFYNQAFGAEEVMRLTDPNGRIVHCEIKIADTIVMLGEDKTIDEGTPSRVLIHLYTGDVEGMMESAVSAGGELMENVQKQFYGERTGRIRDPFGIEWSISTHMEDLTYAQIKHRFDELYS